VKSAEKPSIGSSMKEFTRTSVLEPARFSFHGLDLSRFIVYVFDLFASSEGCEM
jgi:hypothetical protein